MQRDMTAVGQWYQRRDTRDLFQVVDCDELSGIARVQLSDGSLDEIDQDTWRAVSPQPVEVPEDWTGPLDTTDTDDLEEYFTDADAPAESWYADEREPWEALLPEENALC